MPNCDEGEEADSILDAVLSLLDEQRLKESIDLPIERALATFDWSIQAGDSSMEQEFLRTVAEFSTHMYKQGLPLPQTLSPAQATGEAIELLERTRAGLGGIGYDDALLDFIYRGKEGLEMVLAEMTATLKAMERQKYFRWIMASYLDHLEWKTKCSVVKALLARWCVFLPQGVADCPGEQVVYLYAALIRDHIETHQELKQLAGVSHGLSATP